MRARGLLAVAVAGVVLAGSCAGGVGGRVYRAQFTRAVQVFPAVKVRVLGVAVGQVVEVQNVPGAVEVTFRIDDDGTELPAEVEAAVVPASLLGERYIQLFPAYQGGPTLEPGSTIPLDRTAVPSEPDELLRSLQGYLGALDPEAVNAFVEGAARILEGNGAELNRLIEHGSGVISTLANKRDDLAEMFVQFNRITQALATRQESLGRLIDTYGEVTGVINRNRDSVEGTVTGLTEAARELASLLIDHRDPLGEDIQSLTRTSRTLQRNVEQFARTGGWATRLFQAASRAVDYDRDWLRLGNQGHALAALIVLRLQERLIDLCADLGAPDCQSPMFWFEQVPELFCVIPVCDQVLGAKAESTGLSLARAIEGVPALSDALSARASAEGTTIEGVVSALLEQTVGNPLGIGGAA